VATTNQPNALARRIQAQLGLLVFQFLLGMAVNLLGNPKDLSSIGKFADATFLVLHVLTAIGLVVNASVIIHRTIAQGAKTAVLAKAAAASIGAAFICGLATLFAPFGELWSYLMAVAFIAAVVLYGRLFARQQLTSSHN
jgi:hypothetical protein